ncbi:chemotaxis protein CheW [Petroclostridium sp. X23]|uniref:chemotaxis protein CheW n=1 Tax=Petroclostridium sp. X23 TaxID=3045146 RepID=UPI0024AD878B|nr:chemotaxis protein CheW [Petroclostridium sp. X23]WHH60082.1 chemotaxis protein CheW [Petroclostridium sp. X23]
MEIGVGKSKYTAPITSIKESFKPDKKNVITDSDGNDMVMVRGECYPILRIHKIFKINTNATSWDEGVMVMVESDIGKAYLFADQLIGEQQVVIKGLPNYLKRIRGIAG